MKRRNEAGQALVETALTLPILLLLILGAAELARIAYISIEVANAAEAGALYGSQNAGTAADTAGIRAAAQSDSSDIYKLTGSKVAVDVQPLVCQCEPETSTDKPTTVTCSDNTTCAAMKLSMETTLTVSTSVTIPPIIQIPGLPLSYKLPGQSVQKVLNN
jgi:Flp pilus assembly protein TadG